jgi:hypothetical protein
VSSATARTRAGEFQVQSLLPRRREAGGCARPARSWGRVVRNSGIGTLCARSVFFTATPKGVHGVLPTESGSNKRVACGGTASRKLGESSGFDNAR